MNQRNHLRASGLVPIKDDVYNDEILRLADKDERSIGVDPKHSHQGSDASRIALKDMRGMFKTVDAVPTHTPKNIFEQIKIYKSGATLRVYIYDESNKAWTYAALT